ncbi:hypothetical protein Esti_004046 [Eimeria stiedai]
MSQGNVQFSEAQRGNGGGEQQAFKSKRIATQFFMAHAPPGKLREVMENCELLVDPAAVSDRFMQETLEQAAEDRRQIVSVSSPGAAPYEASPKDVHAHVCASLPACKPPPCMVRASEEWLKAQCYLTVSLLPASMGTCRGACCWARALLCTAASFGKSQYLYSPTKSLLSVAARGSDLVVTSTVSAPPEAFTPELEQHRSHPPSCGHLPREAATLEVQSLIEGRLTAFSWTQFILLAGWRAYVHLTGVAAGLLLRAEAPLKESWSCMCSVVVATAASCARAQRLRPIARLVFFLIEALLLFLLHQTKVWTVSACAEARSWSSEWRVFFSLSDPTSPAHIEGEMEVRAFLYEDSSIQASFTRSFRLSDGPNPSASSSGESEKTRPSETRDARVESKAEAPKSGCNEKGKAVPSPVSLVLSDAKVDSPEKFAHEVVEAIRINEEVVLREIEEFFVDRALNTARGLRRVLPVYAKAFDWKQQSIQLQPQQMSVE